MSCRVRQNRSLLPSALPHEGASGAHRPKRSPSQTLLAPNAGFWGPAAGREQPSPLFIAMCLGGQRSVAPACSVATPSGGRRRKGLGRSPKHCSRCADHSSRTAICASRRAKRSSRCRKWCRLRRKSCSRRKIGRSRGQNLTSCTPGAGFPGAWSRFAAAGRPPIFGGQRRHLARHPTRHTDATTPHRG